MASYDLYQDTSPQASVKEAQMVRHEESKELSSEYAKLGPMPVGGATGLSEEVHSFQSPTLSIAVWTYICYALMTLRGHIVDFLRKIGLVKSGAIDKNDPFKMTQFYQVTRNVYMLIRDCWERPIASVAGPYVDVVDRESDDGNWTYKFPGTKKRCLNLGSYNYLGFAENSGPCAEAVKDTIRKYGVGNCSSRAKYGNLDLLSKLEKMVAHFVGKQDAVVFGMGFATNSTNMRSLITKGSLLISDELNHTSLIVGARLTGAKIEVFKHNDIEDLERKLKNAIIEGQPRTHRPWKKILIVVEGIYSMEGSIVKLPEIIALKKKYKAYLYLDEAHSIGAIGPTGRGVVEYWGCDPNDVDIMMGTFTKSFGACGGYIAANHDIINHIRKESHSAIYGIPMVPPVAQQAISTFHVLLGKDGTQDGQRRITALAENTKYFRQRVRELGFAIYGHDHSPVVPIFLYFPGKLAAFSRMLLERKIATVVVGFPATPLLLCRARICLSADHTREMLDEALLAFNELGDLLGLKYGKK